MDSMNMNSSKLQEIVEDRGASSQAKKPGVSQRVRHDLATEKQQIGEMTQLVLIQKKILNDVQHNSSQTDSILSTFQKVIGKKNLFNRRLEESCMEEVEPEMVLTFWGKKKKKQSKRKKI